MLLPPTCPLCHRPGPAPCPECLGGLRRSPPLPPPPGVDACGAVLAYEEAGRELVARLKYRNARSVVGWLAARMAAVAPPADLVTWAPTTSARRRERGFDQAALLARAVARQLRLPCRDTLERAPGPAQTGRALADRRIGPQFAARRPVGGTVLLVDDVVTSGATAAAAARALRRAGAGRVVMVAGARVPPPWS